MKPVKFFEKDGKLHFSIPGNPLLESRVRAAIKSKSVKVGPKEFYFRRGVLDVVSSIIECRPRKYGTPTVKITNPFNQKSETMPCQEAKKFLSDVGGNYYVEQVGGSKLPEPLTTYLKNEQ